MLDKFSSWGPVTVLLIGIVFILTVAGAVVTIVQPDTLSFESYLDKLQEFLIALGILGVARGAKIGLERSGKNGMPGDITTHPDYEAEPQPTSEDEGMGAEDEPDLPRRTV